MARLKTINHVPPKGWSIEEPDGFELKGSSEGELIQILMRHRKAKGNPISHADARSEIHAQICDRWPQGCVKDSGDPTTSTITWKSMANKYVSAVARFIKGDFPPVTPEEATNRASICLSCPFNKPSNAVRPGCPTCKRGANIFNALVDSIASVGRKMLLLGAKTEYDDRLRVCGMCGCDLKSMVHFPLGAFAISPDERKLITAQAPWCWKVT